MFIDTHAHIHQHSSDESDDIIERATAANVGAIITAGTTIADSQLAIEMAKNYSSVFAGVGVHPTDIDNRLADDDFARLSELADSDHVVVMSEVGVDHQDKSPDHEWQAEAFYGQIKVAREHSLPIVFHIREQADDYDAHSASDAALSILKETSAGELGGTAHYFQGRWGFAKELLDLGFNISFAKTLTRIVDLEETALRTPSDRILVETDAYPQTFKKNRAKWTEPQDIPIVAEKLAVLRRASVDEIRETSTQNALTMLGSRSDLVASALENHRN